MSTTLANNVRVEADTVANGRVRRIGRPETLNTAHALQFRRAAFTKLLPPALGSPVSGDAEGW